MQTYIVVDIEGSKKPQHLPWVSGSFLVNIGVLREDGTNQIYWFNHDEVDSPSHEANIKAIQTEIDRADVIIAHNAKFDLNWLRKAGLKIDHKDIWCTMIADYLIYGQKKIGYSLNACAHRLRLGKKEDKVASLWEEGYNTNEIPMSMLSEYLIQDLRLTEALYLHQREKIVELELEKIAVLNFKLSLILSGAEYRGIKFDANAAEEFVVQYKNKITRIDERLFKLIGMEFNVGSNKQLSAVLYGGTFKVDGRETYTRTLKSGIVREYSRKVKVDKVVEGLGFNPLPGTESANEGQWSVDKGVLKRLKARSKKQRIILKLLALRAKFNKIVSTFISTDGKSGLINKVGNDGYIHPSFNQTVTATGRLSSSNPNAQNLPRKGRSPIKKTFVPRRDKIVNVDLSQIEFRIGAELSRDPVMVKEVQEGLDVHTDNAIKFFKADPSWGDAFEKVRTTAKIMTFRLLYGGTAAGFANDSSMPDYSKSEWENIVSAYYRKYQTLEAWQKQNIQSVAMYGALRNPTGRILGFTQTRQRDGSYAFSAKQACNYPVQSASADLMYLAMVELMSRVEGLECDFLIQVHDSMVFDCADKDVETLCKTAVEVFESLPELAKEYFGWDIIVPLTGDCEVGPSYGELKKFNV